MRLTFFDFALAALALAALPAAAAAQSESHPVGEMALTPDHAEELAGKPGYSPATAVGSPA